MSLLDLNVNSDINVFPSLIKEYIRKNHTYIDLDKYDFVEGFYKLDERSVLIPQPYDNFPLGWYIYYENGSNHLNKPMIFISRWVHTKIREMLHLNILEDCRMIVTLYDIINQ